MCVWPPLGGNESMKFRVIIQISKEAKLILHAGVHEMLEMTLINARTFLFAN